MYQSASLLKTVYAGSDTGLKLDFINSNYILGDTINQIGFIADPLFTGLLQIGDPTNVAGGTTLIVDNASNIIKTQYNGSDVGLKLDFINSNYILGDTTNQYYIELDLSSNIYRTVNNYNYKGFYFDYNTDTFDIGDSAGGFRYNYLGGAILGDYFLANSGTTLNVNDYNQIIKTQHLGSDKGIKLDFFNNNYFFGDVTNLEGLSIDSTNKLFSLGDVGGLNSGPKLEIDSFVNQNIKTYYNVYGSPGTALGLNLDFLYNIYELGDYTSTYSNGGKLTIDNNNQVIKTAGSGSDTGLYIDFPNQKYILGDWNNPANGSIVVQPNRIDISEDTYITGSLNAPSITGSLFGTASWALNFVTSSVTSASYAFTASSAVNSFNAISASYAFTASSAISSSRSITSLTASSADNFIVRGNTSITGSVTISQSLAVGTRGVNVNPGRVFSVFASASNTITSNTGNARFISDGQFFSSGPYIGTYYSAPYASYIQVARPSDSVAYPLVLNPLGANVGIGTSNPQAGLDINGSGRFSNGLQVTSSLIAPSITGSLFGTASNAQTASSADSFVVRQSLTASSALITGVLTAQTLVVSTVSSSVIYSSGSNIFGNQVTNVQQFTGSLRVTGSGNHWIIGGNVGIDTPSPTYKLQVNGSGNGLYVIGANSSPFTQTIASFVYGGNNNSINVENQGGKASLQARDNTNSAMNLHLNPIGGNVGIGTTTPTLARLQVNGNVHAESFTGSLFGTASWAQNFVTSSVSSASFAAFATSASYAETASFSSDFTVGSTLTIDQTLTDYATVASSIVGSNNLFTRATGSFTSAFFKYTVTNGVNSRSGEVIAVWNGSTTEYTDFSTVDIGNTSAVTASASIVSSQIQFNMQTNTGAWRIKTLATFM